MSDVIFEPGSRISVRSLYIGQRLNLKIFEGAPRLGSSPLLIHAGERGCAALFRYGAVVLFNLDPMEEVAFLKGLQAIVADPVDSRETDTAEILIDPEQPEKIVDKYIRMRAGNVENIQILADVLAKSVAMSWYEANIAESFERIEPMADELQRRGQSGRRTRELLSHIGQSLLIQSRMAGRVEVEDKPDMLWDRPDLERLYIQLANEYDLRERITLLNQKLAVIHQTAETLLSLLQNKRSLHVEWYIVILILFEIIMSLYDRFFAGFLNGAG
ncbi:MAG: RMD1 family protein [Pseudomonadota bacterium]|nr:RMD1 family protein [Pseudomonadota bacterium]